MSALARRRWRDDGMTMVEVLVAMGLFAVIGSLVLSVGIATARVTDNTTGAVDLNEEARVAFERLARDLRDAVQVTEVVPASTADCGADAFTGLSFHESSTNPAVPQDVAYRWNRTAQQLVLSEAIPDPEEQPILAAKVTRLCVHLWSSRWSPLPAHPERGTSWPELNPPAAPAPGTPWCPPQLTEIDRVTVEMTAEMNGHTRNYQTDVFMRNVNTQAGEAHVC